MTVGSRAMLNPNRPGWFHWQEETPVAVSLVLSVAMMVLTLLALWVWPGGAFPALP